MAACLAKAKTTCNEAQKSKHLPCRYELHEGPAAGWAAAQRVAWLKPKAKKKKRRRARKKKRKRRRRTKKKTK